MDRNNNTHSFNTENLWSDLNGSHKGFPTISGFWCYSFDRIKNIEH